MLVSEHPGGGNTVAEPRQRQHTTSDCWFRSDAEGEGKAWMGCMVSEHVPGDIAWPQNNAPAVVLRNQHRLSSLLMTTLTDKGAEHTHEPPPARSDTEMRLSSKDNGENS